MKLVIISMKVDTNNILCLKNTNNKRADFSIHGDNSLKKSFIFNSVSCLNSVQTLVDMI